MKSILLNLFVAIDFSVLNLVMLALFLWLIQAVFVQELEQYLYGKSLGVQWYDLAIMLFFIAALLYGIYELGDMKNKVGYIIEINRINVNVKGDE